MARETLGGEKCARFNMFWTEDEMRAVENWRWANRVPSMSEAVRQLIAEGLRSHDAQAIVAEGE